MEPVTLPVFVALTVTLNTPLVVGVPLMAPVLALTVKPAGKPDAAYEAIGPLLPSVVMVYCVAVVPLVPLAVFALLMVGVPVAFTRIT